MVRRVAGFVGHDFARCACAIYDVQTAMADPQDAATRFTVTPVAATLYAVDW